MASLDLSQEKFTDKADKVYSDNGIYNPGSSYIETLKGADEIIGNDYADGDFGFGVFVDAAAEDLSDVASVNLSGEADIYAAGIDNDGSINTNKGEDLVSGRASAKIVAFAQTVSQAMAYAEDLDTNVITQTFADININAIANGINNSGEIKTGKGNDSLDGEITGSVTAIATAEADAIAIVECIAETPVNESVTAFAAAIAQSLANATIAATAIKNVGGKIATQSGADTINATANSDSATYAEASTSAFAAATPENQALALAVAEAIAKTQDKAIAIDNTKGGIDLGQGKDIIKATANAADKAIAIDNTFGNINTGKGKDQIEAYATGIEAYGIFGGTIDMGKGADRIEASSFGGGVNINMGNGKDFVEGFGNARVEGGQGRDTFSLGSYKFDDFNISLGSSDKDEVYFERDGIVMSVTGFEKFNFDYGSVTLDYKELFV